MHSPRFESLRSRDAMSALLQRLARFPLWAKIAAPVVVALLVVSGVAGASKTRGRSPLPCSAPNRPRQSRPMNLPRLRRLLRQRCHPRSPERSRRLTLQPCRRPLRRRWRRQNPQRSLRQLRRRLHQPFLRRLPGLCRPCHRSPRPRERIRDSTRASWPRPMGTDRMFRARTSNTAGIAMAIAMEPCVSSEPTQVTR